MHLIGTFFFLDRSSGIINRLDQNIVQLRSIFHYVHPFTQDVICVDPSSLIQQKICLTTHGHFPIWVCNALSDSKFDRLLAS